MKDDYGTLISANQVQTLSDDMLPNTPMQTDIQLSSTGTALYYYKTEGKINGIIVADQDRNLPIDKQELLLAAFVLQKQTQLKVFSIAAGSSQDLKAYNEIYKQVREGTLWIQEEEKQYDASKGAFIVWLKVSRVCYRLNKRFNFIRQDKI